MKSFISSHKLQPFLTSVFRLQVILPILCVFSARFLSRNCGNKMQSDYLNDLNVSDHQCFVTMNIYSIIAVNYPPQPPPQPPNHRIIHSYHHILHSYHIHRNHHIHRSHHSHRIHHIHRRHLLLSHTLSMS